MQWDGWLLLGAVTIVLLAPSANAMKSMLHACDVYATQYSVLINAYKSKSSCCHPIGKSKHASCLFCYPSVEDKVDKLVVSVEKQKQLDYNCVIDLKPRAA